MSWPTTTRSPAAATSSTKPAARASTISSVELLPTMPADVVGLHDGVEARASLGGCCRIHALKPTSPSDTCRTTCQPTRSGRALGVAAAEVVAVGSGERASGPSTAMESRVVVRERGHRLGGACGSRTTSHGSTRVASGADITMEGMPRSRRVATPRSPRRLARDRHGRGMRSAVTGPHLEPIRTRLDEFDFTIATTAAYLRGLWPELEGVVFEVAQGPAGRSTATTSTAGRSRTTSVASRSTGCRSCGSSACRRARTATKKLLIESLRLPRGRRAGRQGPVGASRPGATATSDRPCGRPARPPTYAIGSVGVDADRRVERPGRLHAERRELVAARERHRRVQAFGATQHHG